MSRNQVANKATNLPKSDDDSFEAYAGAGLETVTAKDLLIPRISILQQLSPQIDKQRSEYIKGAEAGMISDVGTGEIFPDKLWYLPIHFRKDYIEWAPRSSGKGLIAIHPNPNVLDNCKRDEKNRFVNSDGNYIVETAQFFGFNLSAAARPSFIPMASTQLKKGRRWLTLSNGEKLQRADGSEFTAPMFYRTYELTTAKEENNEGSWYGWRIERSEVLPKISNYSWRDLRDAAVKFQKSLLEDAFKADYSDAEEVVEEEAM